MRLHLPTRVLAVVAALAATAVLGAPLAAAAHRDGDGGRDPRGRGLELASRIASRGAPPSLADRRDQATAQCRARGFAGPALLRCVDAAIAASGSGEPGSSSASPSTTAVATTAPPANGGGQPPQATTTAARQPAPPLPAGPPQAEKPRGPVISDRGIVQAAGPDVIVLRALDGFSIIIPLDAKTKVYFGDRPASIADVKPGAVATVRHQDKGIGIDVRIAVPPKAKLRTDRGITESATPTLVSVRLRDGTLITAAMNPGGTVVIAPNGSRLFPGDIRPGLLVDITYDPAGTVAVQTVKIIRRVP